VTRAGTFSVTSEAVVPNGVVVTYDPADGNLSYDGNGTLIAVMELISSGHLFDPSKVNAGVLPPLCELCFTQAKFIKLVTEGIPSVDVGPVLPPGLSTELLQADLQVDGAIKPAGKLTAAPGGGPYLYVVPEPSTLALLACGWLGVRRLRWRRLQAVVALPQQVQRNQTNDSPGSRTVVGYIASNRQALDHRPGWAAHPNV
jgi:hypothetical protein